MNIQTSIPFTGLYLILGISISVAVAYLVYFFRKNKREFVPAQRVFLGVLRGVSLFMIMLLMLGILLELTRKYYEKPILAIAIDHSESMEAGNPSIKSDVESLINRIKLELDMQFDVRTVQFGERFVNTVSLEFDDKASDYNQLFEKLQDQYYNLNLGAVVLVGDGIVNMGESPLLQAMNLNSTLYTVGTGDTTIVSDQSITDVVHNQSVFIGNDFSCEVDLNFKNFEADSTRIEVAFGNKKVFSEKIAVPQPNFFVSKKYVLTAENPGLQQVTIQLIPVSGERNVQNNLHRFSIEVHEKKYKVLMLSPGPHPDLGAIYESLQKQASFEVTSTLLSAFTGSIVDYDLVILNQLPSLVQQQSAIYKQVKESKKAVLVIVGPSTSISALNNLELHFSMEPSQKQEESMAHFNPAFSLFSTPQELPAMSEIFPPLLTFFTKYQLDQRFSVLAYQRINNIPMDFPLIAFGDIDERKVGVIFGEGLWRWRMREYQNFKTNSVFSSMIVNMITYMVIKENKEQFTIRYKTIVDEITPVVIRAKLLDDIFEPVLNAEVSLVLTDSSGAELSYLFDPSDIDYELSLGYLAAGDYRIKAETKLGEKTFLKEGQFSVQAIQLENQNLTANFGLLKEMAASTGGQFYSFDQAETLINNLKANNKIGRKEHTETNIHEIIEWKWLFFIVLFLISLEWFLRKFWGSY